MLSTSEKPSFREYPRWCRDNLEMPAINAVRTYYNSLVSDIKSQVESSDVWRCLTDHIATLDEEYYANTSYDLFTTTAPPALLTKPFESLLDKTYRLNVMQNQEFPNPPASGWVSPVQPFQSIRDLIRARLVVKYVDGVSLTADELMEICKSQGCHSRVDLEATPEGYYAAHLYWKTEVQAYDMDFDPFRLKLYIEIEITTQIQEVVQRLLHSFYEKRRSRLEQAIPSVDAVPWEWDSLGTNEFTASYMGHMLHYIDATIVDVRSRHAQGDE